MARQTKADMVKRLAELGVEADTTLKVAELEEMLEEALEKMLAEAEEDEDEEEVLEKMLAEAEEDEDEEEMEDMVYERANRVAMEVSDKGYVAHFYRTHKHVGDIEVQTEEGVHSAEAREMARRFAIDQCPQYGIEWNPEQQKQAWERKYNIYMTDAEVEEDAITLVSPSLERLAEKSRYNMVVNGIEMVAVSPKESQFSYVEDGRYTKSGAWCVADIELELDVMVGEHSMRIPFMMEMKSGQVCKTKMTIAEWNEMIAREMELNGIEIYDKEEKTA